MIKIENIEISGLQAATRGCRNPLNSWDKSDSGYLTVPTIYNNVRLDYKIGDADLALMKKLCKAGTDHRKFMRMINVTMDITGPLYFFKQFDTYKVGTASNSCSTMHTIHKKPLTLDDFSTEHLSSDALDILDNLIDYINIQREGFLDTNNKLYWWEIIQLLPSSYNQRRTVSLNYEVLTNMYHSRKAHKLDEWVTFCEEIKKLPYSELITGEDNTMTKLI